MTTYSALRISSYTKEGMASSTPSIILTLCVSIGGSSAQQSARAALVSFGLAIIPSPSCSTPARSKMAPYCGE